MSTNHYFNHIRQYNEQNLVEDLVIESIKIKGMDVFYLPRTMMNKDWLFGEDPRSLFGDARPIEMYLETANSFEGSGDILAKFGLEVHDNATFIVSKKRFQKETNMERPMEGDIIYFPLTKGFFELKFVEHEYPFYQLGKNYVFKLSCELFRYSEEVFTTGETEIDNLVEAVDYRKYLSVTGGVGTFAIGSQVYQWSNGSATAGLSGANASATIEAFDGSTVSIEDVKGNWQPSSSTITRYVSQGTTAYMEVTAISDTIDVTDDNAEIQSEADDILDFSEDNPFGEF
jgi:hypothetical protein